jgi:hypothetical protein
MQGLYHGYRNSENLNKNIVIIFQVNLTLCRSYLNPYCLGRKTAFFQWAFKFTCKTINRNPLQGKIYNN